MIGPDRVVPMEMPHPGGVRSRLWRAMEDALLWAVKVSIAAVVLVWVLLSLVQDYGLVKRNAAQGAAAWQALQQMRAAAVKESTTPAKP